MWVYQYDFAGHTHRKTLGNVNAISIQDARKTAGELSAKVRLGRDPVREIAENRERAADTFASVMDSYLMAAKLRLRASTWKSADYHLRVVLQAAAPAATHHNHPARDRQPC